MFPILDFDSHYAPVLVFFFIYRFHVVCCCFLYLECIKKVPRSFVIRTGFAGLKKDERERNTYTRP